MIIRRLKHSYLEFCLPVFIGFVVLFGGASHPGQTMHLWIQLAATILLFMFVRQALQARWHRALLGFVVLTLALAIWTLIQMVPVAETIWQHFGDRTVIGGGYALLGFDAPPALPISLAPEHSFSALLGFLPPLAVIIIAVALGWRTGLAKLPWLIPSLGATSTLFGLAQIFLGPDTVLYFYSYTNWRFPVGFFSNANHQATLTLMCLPFAAALAGRLRLNWRSADDDMGKAIAIGLLFLLNLVGLLAAGSVAGYALLVPVLLLSMLLIGKDRTQSDGRLTGGLVIAATLLTALMVGFSPALDGLGATSFDDRDTSRRGMWRVTIDMGKDHGIQGIGPGAYADAYHLYEDPETVTDKYVNNAHNDYLQIWVEWGLPGIVLTVMALILWFWSFMSVWLRREDKSYQFRRAASIALMVVIIHSLVDYPARTPAIATLSAACLVIMLIPRRSSQAHRATASETEQRSARRVTL